MMCIGRGRIRCSETGKGGSHEGLVGGRRIQPVRRGVGVMVACEHHDLQRLVKVEIHLELKAPHVRGQVSLVVDVEGLRRLVRGCVRVLFTASPSVRAVVSMRAMDE